MALMKITNYTYLKHLFIIKSDQALIKVSGVKQWEMLTLYMLSFSEGT